MATPVLIPHINDYDSGPIGWPRVGLEPPSPLAMLQQLLTDSIGDVGAARRGLQAQIGPRGACKSSVNDLEASGQLQEAQQQNTGTRIHPRQSWLRDAEIGSETKLDGPKWWAYVLLELSEGSSPTF